MKSNCFCFFPEPVASLPCLLQPFPQPPAPGCCTGRGAQPSPAAPALPSPLLAALSSAPALPHPGAPPCSPCPGGPGSSAGGAGPVRGSQRAGHRCSTGRVLTPTPTPSPPSPGMAAPSPRSCTVQPGQRRTSSPDRSRPGGGGDPPVSPSSSPPPPKPSGSPSGRLPASHRRTIQPRTCPSIFWRAGGHHAAGRRERPGGRPGSRCPGRLRAAGLCTARIGSARLGSAPLGSSPAAGAAPAAGREAGGGPRP